MGCNCNNTHNSDYDAGCVCNVVSFIHELQECASTTPSLYYDIPFLDPHYEAKTANTRPFVLFTKSGNPFEAYVPSITTNCKSAIFRVENIDDSCYAVLQPLIVVTNRGEDANLNPICTYLTRPDAVLHATSSYITLDLTCFCGIQCLRDVYIPNC
ncbi:spore coat protein [Bacillus pfraonensis]|uniref:CotY/CotZ family spore coat protein n=1 Tax=Bacillus TaxID=1386 RepID=UPI002A501DBD|nr:spore coat protein [Bacillus pseudomycoides]